MEDSVVRENQKEYERPPRNSRKERSGRNIRTVVLAPDGRREGRRK